jgi:hypothetical protein
MAAVPTDDVLLHRIRGEFLEMPGMLLTPAQARRLWGLDLETCSRLLARLVHAHFLTQDRSGRYSRHGERSPSLPVRMVKAEVDRPRQRRTG